MEAADEFADDDVARFVTAGAPALPDGERGYVDHDGARIWYLAAGSGRPVVLLHGGYGNSENWGYQVPALLDRGYRVIAIDSRGHGRSTRDARPFRYERMAADVGAVLDALHLERAALVGWSDGATIALIFALIAPARAAGVFFFGGNMDPGGVRAITHPNVVLQRMFSRHAHDYARRSPTPDRFSTLVADVGLMMKTEPNYSVAQLAGVRAPVAIVHAEHEEFITREHADYLAQAIPGARLIALPGVSHFAPLQRPERFNHAMLAFLDGLAR